MRPLPRTRPVIGLLAAVLLSAVAAPAAEAAARLPLSSGTVADSRDIARDEVIKNATFKPKPAPTATRTPTPAPTVAAVVATPTVTMTAAPAPAVTITVTPTPTITITAAPAVVMHSPPPVPPAGALPQQVSVPAATPPFAAPSMSPDPPLVLPAAGGEPAAAAPTAASAPAHEPVAEHAPLAESDQQQTVSLALAGPALLLILAVIAGLVLVDGRTRRRPASPAAAPADNVHPVFA